MRGPIPAYITMNTALRRGYSAPRSLIEAVRAATVGASGKERLIDLMEREFIAYEASDSGVGCLPVGEDYGTLRKSGPASLSE